MKAFEFVTLVVLLIFCSASSSIFSQGLNFTGVIVDSLDKKPIMGSVVSLTPICGLTKSKQAESDTNGKFEFASLQKDSYQLKISYLGYEPLPLIVVGLDRDMDIGVISLIPHDETLGVVTIIEKLETMVRRADTVLYRAEAYKTEPNASAQELIEKMAGISIKNGIVFAYGERVIKVTVDGRIYYGNEALTALKTLQSDIIDKVQVFDFHNDQTAFTGFDGANSGKAINIITKKNMQVGVFGKEYIGVGYLTNPRYEVGMNVNWFKSKTRLTVDGIFTNATADQQFYKSFSNSFGIQYTDIWGKMKKVQISLGYNGNISRNLVNTTLNRFYFKENSTYVENSTSTSLDQIHNVNIRFDYLIDPTNSVVFIPSFNIAEGSKDYILAGQNNSASNTTLDNQVSSNNRSSKINYAINNEILYLHKFAKKDRTFSSDITTSISDNSQNSFQRSQSVYTSLDDTFLINQKSVLTNYESMLNANIAFTEPIAGKSLLQFTYSPSFIWDKSTDLSFNINHPFPSASVPDSSISNKYKSESIIQRSGINYGFKSKTISLSIGSDFQYNILKAHIYIPANSYVKKSYTSILPVVSFGYKFNRTGMLKISYRTYTSLPSIIQLQSTIDNSNPLLLKTGNPALKQTYNNTITLQYVHTAPDKGKSIFALISANYEKNTISISQFFANTDTFINHDFQIHAGQAIMRPVNSTGSCNVNAYLNYGLDVARLKCHVYFDEGFDYMLIPGVIDNQINLSNTYTIKSGLTIASNISEKIDFTLAYTGSYNIVENSLQKNSDKKYFTHYANARINWLFWKGFVFNTTAQSLYFTGGSTVLNQNSFVWNVSLGYKFLKGEALELKMALNDILNHTTSKSRTVNPTFIEDTSTKTLRRYFMLTLTYRPKFFKETP